MSNIPRDCDGNELKVGDWVKSEISDDTIEVYRVTHFDKWGNPCSNFLAFAPDLVETCKVKIKPKYSWRAELFEIAAYLVIAMSIAVAVMRLPKEIGFWVAFLVFIFGVCSIANLISVYLKRLLFRNGGNDA